MDYPLCKNANFAFFLNPCIYCLERLVCYIKRRKSFFHDLFSRSMTWEYRGLQGVIRGYRGLQGVTRSYKGLRRVTRDYKRLQLWQGFIRGYRGLQRIIETFFYLERSQILFLSLFCIKIKDEEIWNFWSKRWTNPFEKILIILFSCTVVFIVVKGFFFV